MRFKLSLLLLLFALATFGALSWLPLEAADRAVLAPAPTLDAPLAADSGTETAVLAGGCFWGVQGVFERVNGVQQVLSGYAGGTVANASYEEVSSGQTGHAESVQIKFDPHKISYGQILRIFFSVALNPTELNRQGPDTGTQYRSEVFYASDTQRHIAEHYIAQLGQARLFDRPIVTRIDPATTFYPAESYHQDYLIRHPDSLYIVVNDQPKVANLKRLFPELYLETPVTVLPVRSAM